MSNATSDVTKHGSAKPGEQLPWGPASALVVALVSFIVSQFLAVILVSVGAQLLGLPHGQKLFDTTGGQFAFVVISEGLVLGTLWLFLRRRHGNLRQLGYSRSATWGDAGLAVIGFLIYFTVLIFVANLLSETTSINLDQKQELGFDNVTSVGGVLMAFASLVVLPPLIEETMFRGFLYTGLRKKMPFIWAMLLTSVPFGVLHLFASSQGLLWIAGIDTLMLSLVLCYLREKTGALWAPIMVHALKNSIAFVFYIGLISR